MFPFVNKRLMALWTKVSASQLAFDKHWFMAIVINVLKKRTLIVEHIKIECEKFPYSIQA